jgi:hypothetical protein
MTFRIESDMNKRNLRLIRWQRKGQLDTIFKSLVVSAAGNGQLLLYFDVRDQDVHKRFVVILC